MNIDTRTQAVLLLTAWFTKPVKGAPRPLTPVEWGRFACWLQEKGIAPEFLLAGGDPLQLLNGWSDRNLGPDRIAYLLGRSAALGLSLE